MPRHTYDAVARDTEAMRRRLDLLAVHYEPLIPGYLRVYYSLARKEYLEEIPGVWLFWEDMPDSLRERIDTEAPWFGMRQPY